MDNTLKKILITGSTGLLGSSCVRLFQEKDWIVIGVDNNARAKNLGTPEKQNSGYLVDITDEQAIENLFINHTFDAIIHCAGQASHDFSNNNVLLDFDTNARGTVILLEATRKYCPDAVFVHVSTDKVYGENMFVELVEGESRLNPTKGDYIGFDEQLGLDFAGHRSPFGCSKAAGDMYVQEYAYTFGIKTGVFRPGCITGKNHEGAELHGFLAYLTKCIKEGKMYKIFGFKGKQVRDQIHADDLASVFYHFIQNPRAGEVYNIGGGPDRSVSVLEAIHLIEKELNKETTENGIISAKFSYAVARKGDRIWDVHDISKFRSHYPEWDYKYSLTDIIKDVCSK